jgi:hypothetical protein
VRRRVELHVILLDIAPAIARAAQLKRNRLARAATFAAHCRSWRHQTATDPAGLIPGAISAVVLDRTTTEQLQAIHQHPATTSS